ncbi:MAG: hypothetical protein WCP69_14710 [Bacteroidota bacterium]
MIHWKTLLKKTFLIGFICLSSIYGFAQIDSTNIDSTKSDLTFDFGFTRGKGYINLWPILKKQKTAEKKELQILYPIFIKSTDYKLKANHFQFLPFAITDSNSLGTDRRFLSTYYPSVFRYQKKSFGDSSMTSFKFLELAPNISCFNIGRSPNGLFVENNLFFFVWFKRDLIQMRSHLVVFPLYWNYSNRIDSTQFVFPLFYQKKSAVEKKLNIAILYNYKKSKLDRNSVLFPLWWNNSAYHFDDTITTKTLFPVFWSKRSKNIRNTVIAPFFYKFENSNWKTTSLFPLFSYGGEKKYNFNYFAITPFYWHVNDDKDKIDILFPIFWHHKIYHKKDTLVRNTLFPIYWSRKSKFNHDLVLFPLIYSFKDTNYHSFTLFPLYSFGHSLDKSKRHFDIFPLYWYHQSATQSNEILFPFWWNFKSYYANDTIVQKTLFPIYWSSKSKNSQNTTLFPFVYSRKDTSYHSFTLFPLFSTGHDLTNSKQHLYVFPNYWRNKSLTDLNEVIFPFWWKNSHFLENDTITHKTLFPFYWMTKSKQNRSDIVFPIYWSSRQYLQEDTLKKTTIFPLYWSVNSKIKNNKVLFPIIFSYKNSEYQTLTILPFLSYGHSFDNSRKHFNILPLHWSYQSTEGKNSAIFPLWWQNKQFSNNDTTTNTLLLPIYWSSRNQFIHNKILFPIIYSFKDTSYQSLTVFPFYSSGRSTDSSRHHLFAFPTYWKFTNTSGVKDGLFPVWWNFKTYEKGDIVYRKSFFPLYWSSQSKEKQNNILLPIFFKFNNPDWKSITVFPLFSKGAASDSSSKYFAVTPLFWHFKTPDVERTILFPIIWHTKKQLTIGTFTKFTIFPIYWSSQSLYENNHVFFPFVYSYSNTEYKSFTVLPFFSYGHSLDNSREHLTIFPLYWHKRNKDEERNGLFPLWWNLVEFQEKDTIVNNTIFPLYWSIKTKDFRNEFIFPFVYKTKDLWWKTFTFFPLFSYGSNFDKIRKYTAITPFFWHIKGIHNTRDFLFPIYWRNKHILDGDTTLSSTLLPIYWSINDKNRNHKVLFPLVFSFKTKSYESFTLFPLFSHGQSLIHDRNYLMITPLFGVFKKENKFNSFLFPLYSYRKENEVVKSSVLLFLYRNTHSIDSSTTSILWPLCERDKFKNYSYFRFAPFMWYTKTDTSKMSSLQPIYYSYKSPSRRSFTLFWLLYRYENNIDTSVSKSILWKLYNHEKYANGDFETRFLYLVYANVKKQDKREVSVFPFYYKVDYTNGSMSKSVFFSFYSHFKRYIPEIKEFYEEERYFWFIRFRSNYQKIKRDGNEKYLNKR